MAVINFYLHTSPSVHAVLPNNALSHRYSSYLLILSYLLTDKWDEFSLGARQQPVLHWPLTLAVGCRWRHKMAFLWRLFIRNRNFRKNFINVNSWKKAPLNKHVNWNSFSIEIISKHVEEAVVSLTRGSWALFPIRRLKPVRQMADRYVAVLKMEVWRLEVYVQSLFCFSAFNN